MALDGSIHRRLAEGEDPDAVSESSWERMHQWAAAHGLRIELHDQVPVNAYRWIGLCPHPTLPTAGNPHTLVCSYSRVLWDPGLTLRHPDGRRLHGVGPEDIRSGITFTSIDSKGD
jgi:hypothetical protein